MCVQRQSFVLVDVFMQEAVAISFETEQQRIESPECHFNSIFEELRPKRDEMAKFLQEVGILPTVPDGGYFMVADFANISKSAFNTLKRRLSPHALVKFSHKTVLSHFFSMRYYYGLNRVKSCFIFFGTQCRIVNWHIVVDNIIIRS